MDQKYWYNFYTSAFANDLSGPSDFCLFVLNFFDSISVSNVLDAGCGNGRDSYKLGERYNVLGVDSSGFRLESKNNCKFMQDNFVTIDKSSFDLVYTRFTFHSITGEDHCLFLDSLGIGTYLAIETRSDKSIDEKRYYGDQHYRNFTNLQYLRDILGRYGYDIMYIREDKDFAKYRDENPYCIRVICRRVLRERL